MSSVPELFNAIQIAILGAQKDLEKLDRPETTLEQLREFEERLRSILNQLKDITTKVKADRSDQKLVWQRRVRSISDEYYELKNHFSRLSNNKINMMKRTELLLGKNEQKDLDVEAALLQENDSLARSTTMADYYLEMGKLSLGNLYDQGNVLKRAQRRILDMANSLGLTGNVIHKAMNRSWWDRCLVFTGIIIISLGLFFVWYMKRK
ncbi:hypothetical protein JH06_2827 [Blastocystis sp. subtype 4]|uniref:hypothetical protein n=1 Tax=Blastocystis sp. subtype 4 TaxID=944170 RepID=UPI00071195FC|nr:hypothetical protein JH06_2827 [Blastocystis sp. subtype 4]KNB44934.1 hypothetical protein JH06_2827 [Blastocystis sp. subtype 4]|eukprot:XP_014528375.1 hypothetical protein JH06_2827 [Blastocystis sp. subtype 4]